MKEVIILGCGWTGWDCPFDAETWGVNATIRWALRLDKLFFFDDLLRVLDVTLPELKKTNAELVSTEKNKEIAAPYGIDITVYPLEEIVKKYKTRFFSNSIAYMVAYAIYLGYEKIRLYGIDHLIRESYAMEKGCVEYWVGRAQGAGIEVEISEGSALCQTINGKLYGYESFFDDYLIKHKENLLKEGFELRDMEILEDTDKLLIE